MKVFITGGTGFVGRALAQELARDGHEVLVLTRSAGKSAPEGIVFVEGDPTRPGPWQGKAAEADLAVNLAGSSIFRRWTPAVKEDLVYSRISTTRNLVEALSGGSGSNKALLSTSAVGFYGSRGNENLDEGSNSGSGFLAELARDWEAEALKAEQAGCRTVLMRFGVVLARGGGALGQMLPLFKWGLGGRLGSGRQWFSWIHREDLIRAVVFLAQNEKASGAFNLTAPEPVRNEELTRALGRSLKRPTILPAPGFMVKLALGEFASTLLEGQKVLPGRLSSLGFEFKYPTLDLALADLTG